MCKLVLCNFIIGCFIIVSQVLGQGVHLVTGYQAMAMLFKPLMETAKSFRWNRQAEQVQKIPSLYPHYAFIVKMVYSTPLIRALCLIFSYVTASATS